MDIIIPPSTVLITAGIICIFITLVEFISKIAILRPIKGKEIYLIIFGFILLVAGCGLTIYHPESTATNQPTSEPTPVTIPTPTSIPAITDTLTQIATSTPTPPPEIKITPPLNYKVNLLEDIHGTAKNIQEGDEIWVFVYSYSDNNYYLIGENVTLHNKRWSINRQIGTDDENGAEFDIVAVLADKVAQDKYNYYFKEKGVTAMPNVTDVVEVYDQITVTRM